MVTLSINPAKPETAIDPLHEKSVELFRSMKILISDRDVSSHSFCRTMFEKLGASVDIVRSGPESVSACGIKPYDLLLADCSSPESDAFKAAKDLRRLGVAKRLHIVGIANNVTAEIRQRCVDAGMDGCIVKPPDAAALVYLLAVIRNSGQ
ncbi:MAG: response regulator [Bryobacterales bacterium]|nr:response regulator [Bryobacterales bacterium]